MIATDYFKLLAFLGFVIESVLDAFSSISNKAKFGSEPQQNPYCM